MGGIHLKSRTVFQPMYFLLREGESPNPYPRLITHTHTHSTDKTRWMESIARPEVHKEEEKIYQHWGECLLDLIAASSFRDNV